MLQMMANALREPVVRPECLTMAAAILDELADEKSREVCGITPQAIEVVRIRIRGMWGARRPAPGWPTEADVKELVDVLSRMLAGKAEQVAA